MNAAANRVAIVTGASRGIGRAIAIELARGGDRVVLVGRDEAALAEVVDRVREAGGPPALAIAADLLQPEQPARVVERAVAELGRLDVLVNNAGATKRGDFLALTDEDFLSGFGLKFHAAVRFCRAAWPHLQAAGGCIVNISGIGAATPTAEFTIGGPVNSALINFTKALADRGVREGVRVNTVSPGHIVTDRLAGRIRTLAETRGLDFEAAKEELRRSYGIARFGEAGEIAAMVAYLCSPKGAYVQGATIVVDGGATPGI